jgi:hypothetical protein
MVGSNSVALRNFRAFNAKLPAGSRSPRSHRAIVLWSTPSRRADSFWEIPSAFRPETNRSAHVVPGGSGLYPRNRMTAGMNSTAGLVRFASQFRSEQTSAPICSATCRWSSFSTSRCRSRWSPIVSSFSGGFCLLQRRCARGRTSAAGSFGWDKCRVVFVVMVERPRRTRRCNRWSSAA